MQNTPHPTPPPYSPYTPPRRPGRPWWVWLLGGCAGCGLLVVLAVGVAGFVGWQAIAPAIQEAQSVTAESVKQKLGPSVPFYPDADFEKFGTGVVVGTLRALEQTMQLGKGATSNGVAYLVTDDPPEKVASWYRAKLQAGGWKPVRPVGTGPRDQLAYQKGEEFLTVLIQKQEAVQARNGIMLIKGNKHLVESMARQSGKE